MPDTLARLRPGLSHLITVSRAHLTPARLLIETLRPSTDADIVAVGNLERGDARGIEASGVRYIDENDVDLGGRLPRVSWTEKHRHFGWYKQMFIRLCIDRFMETEQVVILDSEVFVFDRWDERRLYDPETARPRCFYWVPSIRKPESDYRMYRGAAYLLSFLPEFPGVMGYAGSDAFRRHISGVVLFSTRNVAALWQRLERATRLDENIDRLFNHQPDLAFSDHDLYGIAADYGFFDDVVATEPYDGLLGWYDTHDDPRFHRFRDDAMWSMCQRHFEHTTPESYRAYAASMAASLGARLGGGR